MRSEVAEVAPAGSVHSCMIRDIGGLPASFTSAAAEQDGQTELSLLQRAEQQGVAVAPMAVVPVSVEAEFYRLNDLPRRLLSLFHGVDLRDPDEEDLEDLAPTAGGLVREHALLDEVIESFYEAMVGLPHDLEVRRVGASGIMASRGRPALLALKRLWAADWTAEALAMRLGAGGGLAPVAAPVLIHGAAARPDEAASAAVSQALGLPLKAWTDAAGLLTRLSPA